MEFWPETGGWDYEYGAVTRPIAPLQCSGSRRAAVRACAGRPRSGCSGVAMNGTKILWLRIVLVCATALGFVWGATQWTAWRLAFQPQVGEPWFTFRLADLPASRLLLVVVRLRRLR